MDALRQSVEAPVFFRPEKNEQLHGIFPCRTRFGGGSASSPHATGGVLKPRGSLLSKCSAAGTFCGSSKRRAEKICKMCPGGPTNRPTSPSRVLLLSAAQDTLRSWLGVRAFRVLVRGRAYSSRLRGSRGHLLNAACAEVCFAAKRLRRARLSADALRLSGSSADSQVPGAGLQKAYEAGFLLLLKELSTRVGQGVF